MNISRRAESSGKRVADDAAAVPARRVLIGAKLVLGDKPSLFHITEHDVGKRGVGGEWRIGIKLGSSLLRLGTKAGGKFFKKLLLKHQIFPGRRPDSPLWGILPQFRKIRAF